jgi:ribosome-binding protein aMBF1 (putative translation factor)
MFHRKEVPMTVLTPEELIEKYDGRPPSEVLVKLSKQSEVDKTACLFCSSGKRCKQHYKCHGCGRIKLRHPGFRPRNTMCKKHRDQVRIKGGKPVKKYNGKVWWTYPEIYSCPDCQDVRNFRIGSPQLYCVPCEDERLAKGIGKPKNGAQTKGGKKAKKRKKRNSDNNGNSGNSGSSGKNRRLGKGGPATARNRPRPEWADRLRAARLSKGLSQVELAEKLGIGTGFPGAVVSKWELGKPTPPKQYRERLKQIVGWSMVEESSTDTDSVSSAPASPLGAWIRRVREKQGLEAGELAVKAKVRLLLINAIEANLGGTLRAAEVKRLEKVLGPIPKDVNPQTAVEKGVRKKLDWTLFDPRTELPPRGKKGVYKIRMKRRSDLYAYIGTNTGDGDIASRVKSHRKRSYWFRDNAGVAEWAEVKDPTFRYQMEQELIKETKPVFNKQGRTDR